jgi:single-strand DNA-binding protein
LEKGEAGAWRANGVRPQEVSGANEVSKAGGTPRSDWSLQSKEQTVMAEGLNRVMLLGNLGADPELRVTPGGQAVLKLRLATNESYVDRNNVRQERTEWHRVTVWGRRAEALGKILQKGDSLFIEGRLQTSSYDKNGEKRYSTEVVANNIVLPGRGARGERGESPREAGPGAGRPQRDREAEQPPFDDYADAAPGGGAGGAGGAGGGDDDIPF